MAIMHGYTTLASLKALTRDVTSTDDALYERAIEAASRTIDKHCRRRFWQDDAVVARVYTPTAGSPDLYVDDISTSTGLLVKTDADGDGVFETTLTLTTDFLLDPPNAAADGEPWRWVRRVGYWPTGQHSVQVTAKFGWAAVPAEVALACLTQASRLVKRRESPFGIAGSPEFGGEIRLLSKLDPDVTVLLRGRRRHFGAV